jgi:hypothetical protein
VSTSQTNYRAQILLYCDDRCEVSCFGYVVYVGQKYESQKVVTQFYFVIIFLSAVAQSVGIVRMRTQAMEFFLIIFYARHINIYTMCYIISNDCYLNMNKFVFTNITLFSDIMVARNYKNTKKKMHTFKECAVLSQNSVHKTVTRCKILVSLF